VPRLGKPLRNNPFIQSLSDEDLAHFVAEGRAPTDPANTTGVPMPPRGGNPRLTDFDITSVVAFLRTIQDPSAPPSDMSAWVVEKPTAPEGAGPGHQLFVSACSACHGADATGLPGLGKSLRASEFVAAKSDAELATFVKTGRPIWDAENTTGVDMPPKGGNPALTDEQLAEIIQFIRSVHD
jgi:disulfide bond formation protein DsbB